MTTRRFFRLGAGFTIVEILIIVIVISILASIGTFAYTQQQKQAKAAAVARIADMASTGAERYYNKNGEYPRAASLTDTAKIANAFGMTASALQTPQGTTLTPYTASGSCDSPSCFTNKEAVYYITRHGSSAEAHVRYRIGSCTARLASTTADDPILMFIVAYYDEAKDTWIYKKGTSGEGGADFDPPSATCVFS